VLITRDTTEGPEATEHGSARWLEPTSGPFDEMHVARRSAAYRQMSRVENPYGDGFASRRIIAQLVGEETAAFRRFAVRGCEPGEA